MMRFHFLAIALLLIVCAPGAGAQQLYLTDVLEPLFPDSNATTRFGQQYASDVPLGAPADVHVLVQARAGEALRVKAVLDGRPLPLACWSSLVDVPVEQNTGLDSRTEMFKGTRNPYVIRRAPFRIFEAIRPLAAATVAADSGYSALRLSIPARFFKKPGKHTIAVTVAGRSWTKRGTFTARVHDATIPPLGQSTFFYTNWFNTQQMEKRHGLTRWTPAWFNMLDRYAALMAGGRQNCINVPGEVMTATDSGVVLDDARLIAFIDVFRKHGFTYFESPHLMYRGEKDDWGDPILTVSLTGHRYDTPEGKKDVAAIAALIRDFIARHGLQQGWLQHISDEPSAVQAQCYKDVVHAVRAIAPDIRVMEATTDRDTLAGAVDYWCPTIDDFQQNEQFFRGRERLGEKVLVYTCLVPGGPWLNRLLDQERLRLVYFGWGAAHYNTTGYLHWGLNQYLVDDPYTQSVVHHPSPVATPENFLPAGDSHIIYPGPDGPLSSTRFEAFRIGVEDRELLRVLAHKDPAATAAVIARVFRSYTDYTTDVAVYRAARKALLEAVER